MTRRLLLAAVGMGMVSSLMAQGSRPAVKLGVVRVDENVVRAQMAEPMPPPQPFSSPAVTESRVPPPAMPGAVPVTPGSVPVTMGAAVPMGVTGVPTAPPMPSDGGLFAPQPDAPLYAPGSPYLLGNPNSGTHAWTLSAEYLHWWTEGASLPVLATTGPTASNGILGNAGTTILYGGGEQERYTQNGGRFGLGYWFGTNQCWGLDLSGFFLEQGGESFAANSTAYPLLARPFTNLNQGIPFSQLVAYPGLATGGIAINTESEFWGAEANFKRRLNCSPCFRLEGLFGFRYAQFDESLTIVESFTRTPNSPPSIGVPNAASGTVTDSFSTENQFYGGQLGLQSELRRGRWFINTFGKVALGEMKSTVTINGAQSILNTNGTTSNATGGLLALPGANIGTFSQSKFSVLPEFGVNLGYHLTPHFRVFVGYNILWLNNVLRPGDQIDTGLDVTRIPNFPVAGVRPLSTVRPTVPLRDTDVTVQGINFGLAFSW